MPIGIQDLSGEILRDTARHRSSLTGMPRTLHRNDIGNFMTFIIEMKFSIQIPLLYTSGMHNAHPTKMTLTTNYHEMTFNTLRRNQ